MSEPAEVKRRCSTCMYWNAQYGRGDIHTLDACKRHAPTRDPIILMQGSYSHDTDGKWPLTRSDSWCGDWEEFVK